MNGNDLTNFKTESFFISKPMFNSIENDFFQKLLNDESINEFLPDLNSWLEMEKTITTPGKNQITSVVYLDEIPIGILSFFILDEDEIIISYGISPDQRGKNYASSLKKEVCNYLFNRFKNLKYIVGYGDANNKKVFNSINKSGYDKITTIDDPASGKKYFKTYVYSPFLKKAMEGKKQS